jgi:hypothetical protein
VYATCEARREDDEMEDTLISLVGRVKLRSMIVE